MSDSVLFRMPEVCLLDVVRLNTISDISPDEWNDLVRNSEFNTVFYTHQWMTSWWEIFGNSYELALYAARESGTLLGIAPMMVHSQKHLLSKLRVMEFISTGEADYSDFIVTSNRKIDVLKAFFDEFKKNRDHLDLILLDNIPDRSQTPQFLRDSVRKSFPMMREFVSNQCPALTIHQNEDFVLACLRKNDVKTRFNYLSKNGKLEYKIAQTPDEILSELDTLFQLHEDRRFIAGDRSKFGDPKPREFYRKLTDIFLPLGWLRFDSLKWNDEPIAYHYGFYYDDTLLHYTPTFNLDYYKRSPGTVIIKFMLEDLLSRNAKEFDFTRGAESYKNRFSNLSRDNLRFEIYTNSFAWNFSCWTASSKEWLKRKHPALFSRLKNRLSSARISDFRHEIRHVIRKNGVFGAFLKLAQKAFSDFIFNSSTAIIFKLNLEDLPASKNESCFKIRDGRLSDLYPFVREFTPMRRRQFLSIAFQRLNDGEKLFIVEKDNQLVHYSWATITKKINLPEIKSHLDLDSESAYIYHCFTSETARGLGIYPAVLNHISTLFKNDGKKEIFIYCMKKNIPSRKGIEKARFKPLTTRHMTRFLGFTFRH